MEVKRRGRPAVMEKGFGKEVVGIGETPRREIASAKDRASAVEDAANLVYADMAGLVEAMIAQVKSGNAAMAKFLFDFANVKMELEQAAGGLYQTDPVAMFEMLIGKKLPEHMKESSE